MKGFDTSDVRNFVLMGHTGSGKTTLVDAMLFNMGVNDRQGNPEDGSSMVDWTDEEKAHGISVWAKPFDGPYKAKSGKTRHLCFIDTPGYADFYGQDVAASAVADVALVTVDASSGIEVGTTRGWKRCEALGMPRGVVVTALDKENADFESVLENVQATWGTKCVPVMLPDGKGGVFEIMSNDPFPAGLEDRISEIKMELVEYAAETDDEMLDRYLNGEELSMEEISYGLRGAVNNGRLIPVFAVAAKNMVGVDELLDSISRLYPSPERHLWTDAEGEDIQPGADQPLVAKVWRSVVDPFVGQLTFLRIFSGKLKTDSEVYNVTKGQKERIAHIYAIEGKKHIEVEEAHAGNLVAIAKLKYTELNDTLGAVGSTREMAKTIFPNPVMAYSVVSKKKGDEDKLANGLNRLCAEAPTLHVQRNKETHELILSGMGDVQLGIAVERLKDQFNVEVDLNTPKVAYRETVNGSGEGHYRHKKQSGGRGQFGEVYLRVMPKGPADEGWFVNKIVGGAIPSSFIPAVEKGLVDGMTNGAVAGYPVEGVKVEIYDGSYHDVDSSEIAFKIAAAQAFREAMSQSKPVLLEPIMSARIMVPDQFTGDITGDLNHRRGRVLGFANEDGMQVIEADIPQSEMFQYATQIRSMTGGRGSFEMTFARYDVVPGNVAKKIVEKNDKNTAEAG